MKRERKVLFLDMDGVLCTTRSHYAYTRQILMRHLDPVACKLVERICFETGAEIVLSSAWRIPYDLSEMFTMLCNGGFSDVPFHQNWKTPDKHGLTSRGHEIKEWLEQNGNPKYCIIDDSTDMLPEQKPFFVLTDTRNGLLMQDYDKAIEILGKKKGAPSDENAPLNHNNTPPF